MLLLFHFFLCCLICFILFCGLDLTDIFTISIIHLQLFVCLLFLFGVVVAVVFVFVLFLLLVLVLF